MRVTGVMDRPLHGWTECSRSSHLVGPSGVSALIPVRPMRADDDGRRTMSSTDAHGSSVRGAQLLGDLAAQDEARQSDSSGKGPDAGGTGQQVAEDSSLGGRRPVMSLFYLELASLLLIPFCQSSRAASRLLVLGLGLKVSTPGSQQNLSFLWFQSKHFVRFALRCVEVPQAPCRALRRGTWPLPRIKTSRSKTAASCLWWALPAPSLRTFTRLFTRGDACGGQSGFLAPGWRSLAC